MGSRFVQPDVVRLPLADVHRRAHAELLALKGRQKATPDALARSAQRVAHAEALGDWIDVKKQLTTGEQRAIFARMTRPESNTVDPVQVGLAKIVGYLLDWSFTDAEHQPVVVRGQPPEVVASILDGLDVESFSEILTAVEWHVEAMEAARELEKNVPATASAL